MIGGRCWKLLLSRRIGIGNFALPMSWGLLIKYRGIMPPEIDLWAILECLARAAMVLDVGHEDPSNPSSIGKPIAHFDLKPSNSRSLPKRT